MCVIEGGERERMRAVQGPGWDVGGTAALEMCVGVADIYRVG